jgi:hypothetical protein
MPGAGAVHYISLKFAAAFCGRPWVDRFGRCGVDHRGHVFHAQELVFSEIAKFAKRISREMVMGLDL